MIEQSSQNGLPNQSDTKKRFLQISLLTKSYEPSWFVSVMQLHGALAMLA
jgi:hypothetical protein